MKKIISCFLFLGLTASALRADWRSEVSGFFGEKVDSGGAIRYLEGVFESLNPEDKPPACGLLAFLYQQAGDKDNEFKRLGEYFERYGAFGMGFSFLPYKTQNEIALYLRNWMAKYPWVLRMGFVSTSAPQPPTSRPGKPPKLILGVEMAAETYYKISDGENVLKGGQFKPGFNAIDIETDRIFRDPGSYPYVLEFKSGELIVRRELVLGIRLDVFGTLAKPVEAGENAVYELRLYLGDELLATSRKTVTSPVPVKVEVPPPTGVYDPWGPGYQNEPKTPSPVPILAIPALIYDLIKSLKKRDEVEPVPPVELKPEITIPFQRKNAAGDPLEVRATVTLGMKDIRFLPFSTAKQPG